MKDIEFGIDYVEELCKKYNLNIFHKVSLSCAMYGDKQQCNFVMKELQKIGVDDLAISGFLKLMQMKEVRIQFGMDKK